LHSNVANWTAEALDKSWTLLKEVVRTDEGKVAYKVDLNEDLPPVSYIRFRFKECFEGAVLLI